MATYSVSYMFRDKVSSYILDAESSTEAMEKLSRLYPNIKTAFEAEIYVRPTPRPKPARKPKPTRKPKPPRGPAILSLHPEGLPVGFLEYLFEAKSQVEIRIHYPELAESFVSELFSREGIELPNDIRAIDSGSRGGVTVQRTLAGEMHFPTPLAKNILPGASVVTGNITKISRLAVILAVLKAGFQITQYAKTSN
jgi:hypothetical protein